MAQEHVDGLIIGDQLEHVTYRRLIVDLAYNGRLPTVYPYREHFEVGELMVYVPPLQMFSAASRVTSTRF